MESNVHYSSFSATWVWMLTEARSRVSFLAYHRFCNKKKSLIFIHRFFFVSDRSLMNVGDMQLFQLDLLDKHTGYLFTSENRRQFIGFFIFFLNSIIFLLPARWRIDKFQWVSTYRWPYDQREKVILFARLREREQLCIRIRFHSISATRIDMAWQIMILNLTHSRWVVTFYTEERIASSCEVWYTYLFGSSFDLLVNYCNTFSTAVITSCIKSESLQIDWSVLKDPLTDV